MAENEMQENLQMEELEELAGEFTLDDLAEFDNDLEFDVTDLESIKPVYTTKEKLKLILMNNTVFSIIKWAFAAMGLVGLVFYILAMTSSAMSEKLTKTVSKGVRGVITQISNPLPFSLMEILALLIVIGILAYAGFLIYKSVKQKEGVKIIGYWVQFAYVLIAVFGVGFLLYTLCYGVTTNRKKLYKTYLQAYSPQYFKEQTLDNAMIFYTDQLNQIGVEGMANIYYTASGNSRYAASGYSMKEINKAVNACFDLAAADFKCVKGGHVTAKKLLLSPLYTMLNIGSIYSPFTSEVLINTDYPEVVVPMQIARATAKQRGITNDADASMIAFLVCSQYPDLIQGDYNIDFIKYSAYFDAYLEVGNLVYKLDPNMHLFCAAALKESIKKDVVAYVKNLDALYGNKSTLEFTAASAKTSTKDYKVLAKLLYMEFNTQVQDGKIYLQYDNGDYEYVPATSKKWMYTRYLVAYFTGMEDGFWGDEVEEVYEKYNPDPLPNDGSGAA